MKLTSVKAIYPKYKNVGTSGRTPLWLLVGMIATNTGITGYGYGGGGKASLPIINGHFEELLCNRDLNSVDDIRLYGKISTLKASPMEGRALR